MNRRQIKPGELMPMPKLDFSGIRLDATPEEVEQMRREVAACSSKEAILKNLSYFRKHSECLISWDMPYTPEEYEQRLLAGEFD